MLEVPEPTWPPLPPSSPHAICGQPIPYPPGQVFTLLGVFAMLAFLATLVPLWYPMLSSCLYFN